MDEIVEKPVKNKILKYILRTLAIVGVTVLAVLVLVVLTVNMFFNGPSQNARQIMATTVLETGAMKFVASIFLSDEEIQALVDDNSMTEMETEIDFSLVKFDKSEKLNEVGISGGNAVVVTEGKEESTNIADKKEENIESTEETVEEEDIEIIKISDRTFSATLMIIKDPSRVSLSVAMPWGKAMSLDKHVTKNEAVAAINGGLYDNTYDNGCEARGVVVSNGEIYLNNPSSFRGLYMIGFNNDDMLVIKKIYGMTSEEFESYVKENGIRDAVAFQDYSTSKVVHFVPLIINGEPREITGMGSGLNPRTAIGQRADGAVLLLVTDGRGAASHLGACAADLINIMQEYEAVNAANLDGGSSSCMYYGEEYLMASTTFYYYNSSWALPTAFIVK